MVIGVIDTEDPEPGNDRQGQLDRLPARSLRLVMCGMCNGVAQVISDIAQRAPLGGLNILRIWSHGRSGGQTSTGGHGGEAYRGNRSGRGPGISLTAPGAQRRIAWSRRCAHGDRR
jgi:hypothetical protein